MSEGRGNIHPEILMFQVPESVEKLLEAPNHGTKVLTRRMEAIRHMFDLILGFLLVCMALVAITLVVFVAYERRKQNRKGGDKYV